MTYYCWRCSRRLDIVEAPVNENCTVRCPRCKSPNVVQAGHDPAEKIAAALDNNPAVVLHTSVTTT